MNVNVGFVHSGFFDKLFFFALYILALRFLGVCVRTTARVCVCVCVCDGSGVCVCVCDGSGMSVGRTSKGSATPMPVASCAVSMQCG